MIVLTDRQRDGQTDIRNLSDEDVYCCSAGSRFARGHPKGSWAGLVPRAASEGICDGGLRQTVFEATGEGRGDRGEGKGVS